jgi:RHS repeat-associated protein
LAYDGAGRVVHETQNGNAATTIVTTYDALGRKTQVTDPDSGTWRYGYDAGGNLTSLDDPVVGQRVEYEYDALNRLLRKRAFGLDALGQETVTDTTYSYDSALCGLGRIARVDDASGSTTVAAYTSRGNVLQSTKTIAFDGDARFFVSSSTFDDLGRAKTTLYPYPDANKVETVFFDYNWSGRLSRIRSDHGGYLLGAKFDEFGHVVDLSYGNGVHDQATYWDRSAGFRLKELITRKPAQAPLRDVLYRDYDPNGQVLAIHDQLHNAASPLSLTQLATYDDASRLVGSVQCGGGRYQGTFSHDAYGNLSSKEGAGYTYNADGPHQPSTVGGIDVEYDDNGNVVGLPGDRTLVYDAEGRLVRVDRDGTTIARYLYDYSGRRVAAQTPQGTRLFFDAFDWHDDEIVRYFRVGDRLIASSPVADTGLLVAVPPSRRSIMLAQMVGGVPALGLLAIGLALAGRRRRGSGLHRRWVRRPAAVLVIAFYLAQLPSLPAAVACPQDPTTATPPAGTIFYHADHLGSPQLLTNHQGAVLEHLVHRPYGMLGAVYDGAGTVVDESQSPFSFTGHRADDGTGLTYMGARYYDLALGMFVSHDPARQFASPYSYGAGNPLNGRDPTGAIFGIDDAIFWGIVIGFAVLGGVAAGVQASLNGASVGQAVLAGVLGAVQSGVMAAVGIVGGPGLAAASPTLSTAFSLVSVGYAVYSGYQAIDSGQYATGALALLTAAIAIAGAAYGALGSSSAELATGNTEQTGIQLAGNTEGPVLNDAGPQYAVQDHEIYIGAKFTETDAQAGKVGIGHSFVGLREPGGEIQTYGFYPRAGANFDGIKALRTVPGSLREGVDQGYLQSALAGEKGYSVVKYSVTRSQYLKALDVVTAYQSNSYSAVFRNCTHFALDLAGAAGVRVPSAGLISRPAVFQPALRHFGERLP